MRGYASLIAVDIVNFIIYVRHVSDRRVHMPCDIFSDHITGSNESWDLLFPLYGATSQKCT